MPHSAPVNTAVARAIKPDIATIVSVFMPASVPASGTLMHHLRVIWNQSFGASVDGPGSLLNYQGHPVERLTPDRHVTIPSANTGRIVPEKSVSRTIFGLGTVADS